MSITGIRTERNHCYCDILHIFHIFYFQYFHPMFYRRNFDGGGKNWKNPVFVYESIIHNESNV